MQKAWAPMVHCSGNSHLIVEVAQSLAPKSHASHASHASYQEPEGEHLQESRAPYVVDVAGLEYYYKVQSNLLGCVDFIEAQGLGATQCMGTHC